MKQVKKNIIFILKFIQYSIFFIPSFLFLILIRIIKPIIHIRFGSVLSARIGHFVYDIEFYLCQKNKLKNKSLDFFYLDNQGWPLAARNKFLLKMVKRKIYSSYIFKYIIFFNNYFPDSSRFKINMMQDEFGRTIDLKHSLTYSNPQLNFTILENQKGTEFLSKYNIQKNDKYICLVVRDSEYLNQEFKGRNWSYHNYRDADIKTYFKACIYLANKGYKVFRMGKIVKEKIENIHPNIIDYANSEYRSDFLDIWLLSNCYYSLCTNTGLDSICRINKIPFISSNFLPARDIYVDCNVLTAPKKLYWKSSNIQLNLSEMIEFSYGRTEEYIQNNIDILDLNENEILDCVLQMEEKLNNIETRNKELQKKSDLFWKVFTKKVYGQYKDFKVYKDCEIANFYLKNLLIE